MAMRKTVVDKSVRFIPKTEQTKERDIKPKLIKAGSLPRKQNQNIPQNSKKFLKNVAASVFASLTKEYLYKYKNKYIVIHF